MELDEVVMVIHDDEVEVVEFYTAQILKSEKTIILSKYENDELGVRHQ